MWLAAAGVPWCEWILASFSECRNQLCTMGQGISPLGQHPEVLLLPRKPDYGLLQPWLSKALKVTESQEGLRICVAIKKRKIQRISVVLVVK